MAVDTQNKTYFYVFLIVVLALGLLVLWPMRDIILVSFVITTLFRPVYEFFVKKAKTPRWVATLISVFAVLVTVLIPVSIFINITISQFGVFYRDIATFSQGGSGVYEVLASSFGRINTVLERIPYLDFRLSVDNLQSLIQQNLTPIANFLLSSSVNVGVSFAQSFPLLVVFVYLIWYGFPEYDRMLHFAKRLSPLTESLDNLYLDRVTAMVRGIAKGTFTIALVQGSIAAISLWIAGVPYVFFWFIVLVVLSVLPLGASLVTVPTAIVLFMLGHYWQAILVILIQFLLTSTIDNIMRPYLIPKEAELHPVLLLLSFIGGVQVFGPWGFIYGPLIMVVLITTFEVYQKYYKGKGG